MERLKISGGNAKIEYPSLSLPSGRSCPSALDCLAKVKIVDGKRKIFDGAVAKFRCFSATTEAVFRTVYEQREHNYNLLRECNTVEEMHNLLNDSIKDSYTPFRIHVGGDFFNQNYFDAWVKYAGENPHRIFYAYTKSIKYWVKRLKRIPNNLKLTASRGGRDDDLIRVHTKLKNMIEAIVVSSEQEAREKNLEIDTDDSLAIRNTKSFALVIHGTQKQGSEQARIVEQNKRNKVHSYSKNR
jgi:hypothetical protein